MVFEQVLFICFVAGMFGVVVAGVGKFLSMRTATVTAVSLSAWFSYVAVIWHFGLLQRTDTLPPGMALILGPVALYIILASICIIVKQASWPLSIPLALIVGAQSFRVIVELFIHQLWTDGLVPQMLTFNGANVDIYIGASAPLVPLLANRKDWGRKLSLIWNFTGLLALLNVVSRAILTAPGPLNFIHAETSNRMFQTFPYMFIPAFFVPLAVSLHIIAIRAGMNSPAKSKI